MNAQLSTGLQGLADAREGRGHCSANPLLPTLDSVLFMPGGVRAQLLAGPTVTSRGQKGEARLCLPAPLLLQAPC